jgi:hypothetical protein
MAGPIITFPSARLKVDRAKHHVSELQATLDRYSKRARIEFAQDGISATITIAPDAELACSLIIGDAVHNLRSALDHAYWELMGLDGGVQDRSTSFPIHRGTRIDYAGACKGIPTPRQDTKDFMCTIEAYPDGVGNVFCRIHEIDISDKHALLVAVLGLTALRNCEIIRPDGQRETWDHIGYAHEVLRDDGTATIRPFGAGRFKTEDKAEASFEVLFSEPEIVELEPVIPTLDDFIAEVTSVLNRMERFVAERT